MISAFFYIKYKSYSSKPKLIFKFKIRSTDSSRRSSVISPFCTAWRTAGICSSKSLQQIKSLPAFTAKTAARIVVGKVLNSIHKQIVGDNHAVKPQLLTQNFMYLWRERGRIVSVETINDIMRDQHYVSSVRDAWPKTAENRNLQILHTCAHRRLCRYEYQYYCRIRGSALARCLFFRISSHQ